MRQIAVIFVQLRKQKLREVRELAQGNTGSKWQGQKWNLHLTPKPIYMYMYTHIYITEHRK